MYTPETIDEKIDKLQKEKELLIKKEETKNKQALELSDEIVKLKLVRDETQMKIITLTLELNKLCTHEKVRTEKRYVEGGYLNQAEDITTYYCEICGAKVDEEIKYCGFS